MPVCSVEVRDCSFDDGDFFYARLSDGEYYVDSPLYADWEFFLCEASAALSRCRNGGFSLRDSVLRMRPDNLVA